MSTQIEAPRSEVKSEVSNAALAALGPKVNRQPLSYLIAELIGDKTSAVTFSDLRDAAQRLGMSARRKADGTVSSVDPVERAVFCLLLARFARHQPVTRGQILELVGISRTMNAEGAKGVDGALYLKDGTVKGDSASLGTVKVRPAGASGNVTLD